METRPVFQVFEVVGIEDGHGLEPVIIGRQHIGGEYFVGTVVVEVGDVRAHGRHRTNGDAAGEFFGEGAVTLIQVQVVPLPEVVTDVDVGEVVAVEIRNRNPQTEADHAVVNARFLSDVDKPVTVIAEELISAEVVAVLPRFDVQVDPFRVFERVVENVTVEVAVEIVVEEGGVGAEPFVVQAVGSGLLGKVAIAIVDKQFVFLVIACDVSRIANVDVEFAVAIYVGHGNSRTPAPGSSYSGLVRDVFELPVAFIQVKFIGRHIGREIKIGKAVAVDVPDGNTAAVVVVAVGQYIELLGVLYAVDEVDPGPVSA